MLLCSRCVCSEALVSLELKDTHIGSAIEALFRGTGKNMAISYDIDLSKTITASLKDVSFDAALKSVLKSSNLIYRIDGGVYIIANKPDANTMPIDITPIETPIDNTTIIETQIEKIPLMNVSASEILAILKGENNTQNNYGGIGQNYGGTQSMNQGYGNNGMQNYGGMQGMGQGYNRTNQNNYGGIR